MFCYRHTDSVVHVLQNVKKKMYGCTEAFLADVKWILHNCIIYNGGRQPDFVYSSLSFVKEFWFKRLIFRVSPLLGNHKLTATAKVIVKICEHEVSDLSLPFTMAHLSSLYSEH